MPRTVLAALPPAGNSRLASTLLHLNIHTNHSKLSSAYLAITNRQSTAALLPLTCLNVTPIK
jgi:hypothetical protein